MPELRLKFRREGAAKYLSHLDVFRCFARSFMRADVPLTHSQGFNPHPYISIAHPLSVGIEGYDEVLDFGVTHIIEDLTPDRLNAALPAGLQVKELYAPTASVKGIAFAEYRFVFTYDNIIPDVDALRSFFTLDEIPVTKKTKNGLKQVNLRDYFKEITFNQNDSNSVTALAVLYAHNSPVNPKYFTAALSQSELKPDFARFARLRFVTQDGSDFA